MINDNRSSAFEKEFTNCFYKFVDWLQRHDRFVLFTLLLSVSPLPPAPIIAIILSILQLQFIKSGKLDQKEKRLLKLALLLSFANILISVSIIFMVIGSQRTIWEFLPKMVKNIVKPWLWLEYLFDNKLSRSI